MNTRLSAVVLVFLAAFAVTLGQAQNVKGSGTPGTIPLWTSSSTVGNSAVTQSGNNVSTAGDVSVAGTMSAPKMNATDVIASGRVIAEIMDASAINGHGLSLSTSDGKASIFLESGRFIHRYGDFNVFVGTEAGNFTLTGIRNSALGDFALATLASGDDNTAVDVLLKPKPLLIRSEIVE